MIMPSKHIILCGDRGVGKSTLIQKLLEANTRPVYGFFTKRLAADETGFHPIYIHPANTAERVHTEENRIGTCDSKIHNVSIEVFDTLGTQYLREALPGGIIVMDELGFMESQAGAFVQAVFAALDGEIPIIAAVKSRYNVPFLNKVRAHPKGVVYDINPENRDALFDRLLTVVQAWNAEAEKDSIAKREHFIRK